MTKTLTLKKGEWPVAVDRESDGEKFFTNGQRAKGTAFYKDFELEDDVASGEITSGDGDMLIKGNKVRLWRYSEKQLKARIEYAVPDKS